MLQRRLYNFSIFYQGGGEMKTPAVLLASSLQILAPRPVQFFVSASLTTMNFHS
jgi:hypothetical protein